MDYELGDCLRETNRQRSEFLMIITAQPVPQVEARLQIETKLIILMVAAAQPVPWLQTEKELVLIKATAKPASQAMPQPQSD